jgi:AcrR family transcriptional regulator
MTLLDASADCSGAALRRKQILDAARDAFRTHGFHAASMAVVASGAKMSVGQIYRYFDNKEAIVAAIVGEHIEEFMRDLTMIASADGPLAERLLNNFIQAMRRNIDNGFFSLTYEVRAEAARHPALRTVLVSKDRQIQDSIMDLMASTDLSCCGPYRSAHRFRPLDDQNPRRPVIDRGPDLRRNGTVGSKGGIAYPPNILKPKSTTKQTAGAATASIPATTAATLTADIMFVSSSVDPLTRLTLQTQCASLQCKSSHGGAIRTRI